MKQVFLVCGLIFLVSAAWADETSLTSTNIQGEYILKSADGSTAIRFEILKKSTRLEYHNLSSLVRCKGDYIFNENHQTLQTIFYSCGPSKATIVQTLFTSGQTIESLQATSYILATTEIKGKLSESLPFSIEKVK